MDQTGILQTGTAYMLRRRIFSGVIIAGVSGCAVVTTDLKRAARDIHADAPTAAEVIAFYGIAKGIAEAAILAEPTLAPALDLIMAATDPIIAVLTVRSVDATISAVTVNANARALLLTAAPAVSVIPHPA